jgi:hypothetical protein
MPCHFEHLIIEMLELTIFGIPADDFLNRRRSHAAL